jgi:hypothetical protein
MLAFSGTIDSPGARRWRRFGWLLPAALLLPGCGNVLYAVRASSAEQRFEEARELGAQAAAPYEFYMAREHLEKAKLEAAEADYGDAARLSETAERFAEKAIELTRDAHGGAAR